jgi:hypothetical protein
MNPNFKVTITHCGESTDYIDRVFSKINVKRRENNYDTATLTCEDKNQYYHTFKIGKFDDIKIYFKNSNQTTYTQVFGGLIRQVNPTMSDGYHLILNCKGYGAALEETHCNRDYGIESSNPAYPQTWNILTNIIWDFTNKSFAGATTNHNIDNNNITDIFGTDIKYINNPYKTNLEVADTVCHLTSAIGVGTTSGGHYIIDPSKRFLFAQIGDHSAGTSSPELYWPDWWNILSTESILTEGVDFTEYSVLDKAEEYANHIILVTDFRRPSYDYWSESGSALWGNEAFTSITDANGAGLFVVGANSLLFTPNGANFGYGYYPSTADAAWNVSAWGSTRTIPQLTFYFRKHALTSATTYVYMSTNTTARKTDYFYATFTNWQTEADDTWFSKSIPIGPYWASTEESKQFRWNKIGNPSWSKIDSIEFAFGGAGAGGALYIDDLHFNGKIIRSAKNPTEITRVNGEYQKVLIARNSMDDSCVAGVGAGKDDGYAASIAHAELLRRTKLPLTVSFTLKDGKPQMMAGQKSTVQLGKRRDLTYAVNTTMRLLTVEHTLTAGVGMQTSVTATTDLTNSFPISVPDAYAMWQENMFVNSNEAKNIRAGAEVDLLIPMLESNY